MAAVTGIAANNLLVTSVGVIGVPQLSKVESIMMTHIAPSACTTYLHNIRHCLTDSPSISSACTYYTQGETVKLAGRLVRQSNTVHHKYIARGEQIALWTVQ